MCAPRQPSICFIIASSDKETANSTTAQLFTLGFMVFSRPFIGNSINANDFLVIVVCVRTSLTKIKPTTTVLLTSWSSSIRAVIYD